MMKRYHSLKIKSSTFRTLALLLWSLCLTTTTFGQSLEQKISAAYASFAGNGQLKHGLASLSVMDSKSGKVIFQSNGNLGMPTASTLKVITALTALDILGEHYTYKTKLLYTGTIDSLGTLQGDLIIQGSGDPTLGSERYPDTRPEQIFNPWIAQLRAQGISRIQGRIIGDDSLYGGMDVPTGWNWGDIGNYYGAGISALNWKENKIGITFSPAQVGSPAAIAALTDSLPDVTIVNQVNTGKSGTGDQVYGYTAPYATTILLRGTYGIDLKKTIQVAMPDPALALAQHFKEALAQQNIAVDSVLPTTMEQLRRQQLQPADKGVLLATHESPTLMEIVYWFNQKSVNLYGEALLKSIGLLSGNSPQTASAARLLSQYWQQKLNIPTAALQVKDGSGLSQQNRVTTDAMTRIMLDARKRLWFKDFLKSLPTINQMSMKSGTIGGVLGYTGYQSSQSGQDLTFSLLVNNYSGSSTAMRQEMFKLLNTLK